MSAVYVISSSDSEDERAILGGCQMGYNPPPAQPHVPSPTKTLAKPRYEMSASDDDELPLPLYERVMLTLRSSPTQVKTSNNLAAAPSIPNASTLQSRTAEDKISEILKKGYIPTILPRSVIKSSHDSALNSVVSQSDPANNSIVISSDEDENFQLKHAVIPVSNYKNEEEEKLDNLPDINLLPLHRSCNGGLSSVPVQAYQPVSHEPALPSRKRKTVKKSSEEIKAQREEKRRQREEKLALAQREKIIKQLHREEQQSLKPGECIKFVKAILDMALLELPDAVDLPRVLQESCVQYSLTEQPVRCSVTWKRQVIQQEIGDDLRIEKIEKEEEEVQAITLLPATQFVEAVYHFKMHQSGVVCGDTLWDVIHRQKSALPGKHLTVLICGVSKYFQKQKSKHQREYRNNVLDTGSQLTTQSGPKSKTSSRNVAYEVSRIDVEEAITDLQIREPCNVRFIDSSTELANLIASFTKSIAEAPFKKVRDDHETFSWFANGDSRNAVKVDKDGSGLLTLWQKQVEQFSLVSSDVAQAIVNEYSSPRELIRAYNRCRGAEECEKLLKDIVVRRGVGPLATTRRIGPELSRKIYLMFTSTNGDLVMDAN